MICAACNNTKSKDVHEQLEGDTLDMFNFVCCLDISQPEESQGICSYCIDELRVSFNFKKRCLEIFANVFDNTNHHENHHVKEEDEMDFMDTILGQSLHEDDTSINISDFLITEVRTVNESVLSVLDVSDQSKCRYCFREFGSKDECHQHMEEHKGEDKPYKCPHEGCESAFKARKNLKDHYLVHSNERPFPCHFCDQTFKSSSNRSKHERRIHSQERSAMRAAEAQTKMEIKIEDELDKSSLIPIQPISQSSPQVRSAKKHRVESDTTETIPMDGDERVFQCEHEGCTSSFKSRSSLKDHQKVHSEERPYQCNFCSSAFKSSSNRSKHERSTHKELFAKRKLEREAERAQKIANNNSTTPQQSHPQPEQQQNETSFKKIKLDEPVTYVEPPVTPKRSTFGCHYCDRQFKHIESRNKHESTHKDCFAYDCGYCDKQFKSEELLKEHMKLHLEQTQFPCSYTNCTEVFADRRSLREHKNQHEPEEFICDFETCGKIFHTTKALKNHKTHAKHSCEQQEVDIIECEICEVKFNSDKIAEHLRLHI